MGDKSAFSGNNLQAEHAAGISDLGETTLPKSKQQNQPLRNPLGM